MFEKVSKDIYHLFPPPPTVNYFSSPSPPWALSFFSLALKDSSVFYVDIPGLGGQVCVF